MTTPASAEPTPLHPVDDPPTVIELLSRWPRLLEDLDARLRRSPAAFLNSASLLWTMAPGVLDALGAEVRLKSPRALRALATAASYFRRGLTVDVTGIDLPRWLTELDQAHISRVRHRTLARQSDWLVEVVLIGGHRLAANLAVESGMGALNDALVLDGTARTVEKTIARSTTGPPFHDVELGDAADRLVDALGRYRASVGDPAPDSRWPGNEALVTWLIATLFGQAGTEGRAA